MTVKDLLKCTESKVKITIAWNGCIVPFNRNDPICQDAYNNYLIDNIVIIDESTLEINLKIVPLKAD